MSIVHVNSHVFNGFGGLSWDMDRTLAEYILVPDDDTLSFGNGTTDSAVSFSAWGFSSNWGTGPNKYWFSKANSSGAAEYLVFNDGSARPTVRFYDANTSNYIQLKCNTALDSGGFSGVWTNLVATSDGSGNFAMYLNGTPYAGTASTTGTYVAMENTTVPLRMGSWNGASGVFSSTWNYADPYIFNKELSAAEAIEIYNGGKPRDETLTSLGGNIVSCWNAISTIDGAGGVLDRVGNNHGEMINMTVASNIVAVYPS